MQAKMRPRIMSTWVGQAEKRRQKHTQTMHVIDKEGETVFVFTVEVEDASGLTPGVYDFTESSFAVGEWQAPTFSRDLAASLVLVKPGPAGKPGA